MGLGSTIGPTRVRKSKKTSVRRDVRPKENRFLGKVPPEPASVAKLAATTSGATLGVHGAEAARQLGLTTQVPAQPVFYTSGPTRRLRMGNLEVVLKHVSPRRLALAGRPAGTAPLCSWYLGKRQVNPEVVRSVESRLGTWSSPR
jgi:hypothetical protein